MSLIPAKAIPEVVRLLRTSPSTWPSVREYFPDSLQIYARVLNPARRWPEPALRWSSLSTGDEVTAATEWAEVIEETETSPFPETRGIDVDVATELAATLAAFTATPGDVVFMTWEGYGELDPALATAARTTISQDRRMYILNGDIDDASVFVNSHEERTSQWWIPTDAAWAVGNDIYGASVYVAGSAEAIAAVLASPKIEAFPVAGSARLIAEEFR